MSAAVPSQAGIAAMSESEIKSRWGYERNQGYEYTGD